MFYGSDELDNKKDERLSEFDESVKVIVVMEDDVDVREDMLWAPFKLCFLSSSLSHSWIISQFSIPMELITNS